MIVEQIISPSTCGATRKLLEERKTNAPQNQIPVDELERTETEVWRRETGKIKVEDCATKLQKLHEDIIQYNSTLTLMTCHCAECRTIQI